MRYLLAIFVPLFILKIGCAPPDIYTPPNFIIIFADDLGYGDLGSYGHPTIKTPNLDKMASEGVRFTQFYVGSSICTPSRAALLTGKLPVRTGMYGNRSVLFPDNAGGLDPKEITIASALKEYDYKTACIGKWHLGHLQEYMPTNHGFDEFYGIPYSNDMRPEGKWDYARENFPPLPFLDGLDTIGVSIDQSQFIDMFTKRSVDFIKKNKDKSFFLYLAHTAPHTPLVSDTTQKGRSMRGAYGDVVEELDQSVGTILQVLKDLKIADNTFVIFTSDNGPWGWANVDGGSSGLLKGNKGSVYEGGYRVPAIAWMPGTIKKGTVSTALASTLDLYPTLIAMTGNEISNQEELDGLNIKNTFVNNEPVRHDIHYYRQDTLIGIRHKEWKMYIKDPNPWNDDLTEKDIPVLYNIEHDPSEKYNVTSKHSDIVDRIVTLSEEHIQKVTKIPSKYDTILPEYQSAYDAYNKK
ncbi:MAG: arylsulfatase [Candidatus Neomarinimicrobiota bacterium]|nr:MAG: arylsulfatase [Candidatus Neomarinimicrobiota bacterium]